MTVASATDAWSTEITGGVEAPCMARCALSEMLGDTTPAPTLHDLHLLTTELVTNAVLHAGVGDRALGLFPREAGQRVLDVGCGFGDTTQRIAELVGPGGQAVGVDVAPKFIDTARRETAELGIPNARFEVADVQLDDLGGPHDM